MTSAPSSLSNAFNERETVIHAQSFTQFTTAQIRARHHWLQGLRATGSAVTIDVRAELVRLEMELARRDSVAPR